MLCTLENAFPLQFFYFHTYFIFTRSLQAIMQLTSIFTLIAAVNVPAVMGFKVIAYGDWDCKGSESTINVWDNTCRDWGVADTWSVWVLNYGGKHQRGRFDTASETCLTSGSDTIEYWVDGGDGGFQTGTCINFSKAVKAMSSFPQGSKGKNIGGRT